jgi:sulfur-carrier protein adenylyltransferase/sulfurtransferase
MSESITATELATWLKSEKPPRLLDVREPEEFAIVSLPGAVLVPLGQVPDQVEELENWREEPVVVYCHHGMRSLHAIEFLKHAGFTKLLNLTGGIDAWAREVEPTMGRY